MEAIKDILPKMKMTMGTQNTPIYTPKNYNCTICNDKGFILYEDEEGNEFARHCECFVKKDMAERIERAGLTGVLKTQTFDSFIIKNEQQKKAKSVCQESVNSDKSILILGQVGSGKTHLAFSILGELANQGKYVAYANFVDLTRRLSQSAMDPEIYYKIMGSLQSVEVFMLDDLFKGSVTDAGLKYMYELINARYLNKKKTIITSEKNINQLLDIDEAISSRVIEMAKGYVVNMQGIKNYRM